MNGEEEIVPFPKTHTEVQQLVNQAPTAEVTAALLETATIGVCKRSVDDTKTKFAKWFTAACAGFIIVVALVTLLQQKNSAQGQGNENNKKAECRSVVAGELNIAKAEGIKAGNDYQAILGNILVDAIKRQNPEAFAPQAEQLAQSNVRLAAAAVEIDKMIDRQRRVLEICADP